MPRNSHDKHFHAPGFGRFDDLMHPRNFSVLIDTGLAQSLRTASDDGDQDFFILQTIRLEGFLKSTFNSEFLQDNPDHHGVRTLSKWCQDNVRSQRDSAEGRARNTNQNHPK